MDLLQAVNGPSTVQNYPSASRVLRASAGSDLSASPHILFAGGCHVTGYPVGEGLSLSSVALHSIPDHGADTPNVLSYLNLHAAPLLVDACRRQKTEFLVLQLGHYETLPQFRKILHLHHSHKRGSGFPNAVQFVPEPDKFYQPAWRTRFSFARRGVLDFLFSALGKEKKVFNPAAIAEALDSLLSSLQLLPLRRVFLLSPFSCPDPLVRACRLQAEPIFASAAQIHGCVYVNTFGMLESYGRGYAFWANFSDPAHLSSLGHARVGRLVGENLCRAIEQLRPTGVQAVVSRHSPSLRSAPVLRTTVH